MNAKERMFERVDALIDAGIDVTRISKELPTREYSSVRKQAARAFGSYAQALVEYGICGPVGNPSELELQRCFEITDCYEVVETYDAMHIRELYELDDLSYRRMSNPMREQAELDALDNFYRDHYPFDHLPTRVLRRDYVKLHEYLRKHYETYLNFLQAYKLSNRYVISQRHHRESIPLGRAFERKLSIMLKAIYPDVVCHKKIGACIPDFIVNGSDWVDAKLSANTILDPRCRTLEKYEAETDSLTVYYARGLPNAESVGIATLIHVSALYPQIRHAGRSDLIEDMESFIESVSYEDTIVLVADNNDITRKVDAA